MLRRPKAGELRLIRHLVNRIEAGPFPDGWEDALQVSDMLDGGMGSLRLQLSASEGDRVFGKQISDIQFEDEDGTAVLASLYVDQNGELFELDIWKTDFSSLRHIPDDLEDMR